MVLNVYVKKDRRLKIKELCIQLRKHFKKRTTEERKRKIINIRMKLLNWEKIEKKTGSINLKVYTFKKANKMDNPKVIKIRKKMTGAIGEIKEYCRYLKAYEKNYTHLFANKIENR